jgi:hypothetical protein
MLLKIPGTYGYGTLVKTGQVRGVGPWKTDSCCRTTPILLLKNAEVL